MHTAAKRVRLNYKEKLRLALYVENNPDKKLADYHSYAQDLYGPNNRPSSKTIAKIIKNKHFIKKMTKEKLATKTYYKKR